MTQRLWNHTYECMGWTFRRLPFSFLPVKRFGEAAADLLNVLVHWLVTKLSMSDMLYLRLVVSREKLCQYWIFGLNGRISLFFKSFRRVKQLFFAILLVLIDSKFFLLNAFYTKWGNQNSVNFVREGIFSFEK